MNELDRRWEDGNEWMAYMETASEALAVYIGGWNKKSASCP